MRRLALSVIFLFFGFAVAAAPALKFPELTGRVVDDAHILSPSAVRYLDEKLADYERGTTNQVAVVTLPSLQGDSIEDYSNLLFRHWGLGQKGKDNGVLLAIMPVGTPGERKIHIEVGSRLEPVLTDVTTSEIINDVILPAFKEGDVDRGVINGTQSILAVLGGHSISVMHQHHDQQPQSAFQTILAFIGLILFLAFAARHPFLAMMLLSNSRFGSSSMGNSDWGGNDSDNFRGGGGTASGGGASGSW